VGWIKEQLKMKVQQQTKLLSYVVGPLQKL